MASGLGPEGIEGAVWQENGQQKEAVSGRMLSLRLEFRDWLSRD